MSCIQGHAGFFNCSALKMKVHCFEAQETTRSTAQSHISEDLEPHNSTRPTQFNVGVNNVNSSSISVFGNRTSSLKNTPTTHVPYIFVGSILAKNAKKYRNIRPPPICFIAMRF
jgi:hypothetical protein